jgi:glycogen synthase
LDDFHPEIVHCHSINGRLTTAILDEAKRRGIPVVMTLHDLKPVCPAYLGLRQALTREKT